MSNLFWIGMSLSSSWVKLESDLIDWISIIMIMRVRRRRRGRFPHVTETSAQWTKLLIFGIRMMMGVWSGVMKPPLVLPCRSVVIVCEEGGGKCSRSNAWYSLIIITAQAECIFSMGPEEISHEVLRGLRRSGTKAVTSSQETTDDCDNMHSQKLLITRASTNILPPLCSGSRQKRERIASLLLQWMTNERGKEHFELILSNRRNRWNGFVMNCFRMTIDNIARFQFELNSVKWNETCLY